MSTLFFMFFLPLLLLMSSCTTSAAKTGLRFVPACRPDCAPLYAAFWQEHADDVPADEYYDKARLILYRAIASQTLTPRQTRQLDEASLCLEHEQLRCIAYRAFSSTLDTPDKLASALIAANDLRLFREDFPDLPPAAQLAGEQNAGDALGQAFVTLFDDAVPYQPLHSRWTMESSADGTAFSSVSGQAPPPAARFYRLSQTVYLPQDASPMYLNFRGLPDEATVSLDNLVQALPAARPGGSFRLPLNAVNGQRTHVTVSVLLPGKPALCNFPVPWLSKPDLNRRDRGR